MSVNPVCQLIQMKNNCTIGNIIVQPFVVATIRGYNENSQDIGLVSNEDGEAYFHVADGRQIEAGESAPHFGDGSVAAPPVGTRLIIVAERRRNGPCGPGYYVTRWGVYSKYVFAQEAINARKKASKPAAVVRFPKMERRTPRGEALEAALEGRMTG